MKIIPLSQGHETIVDDDIPESLISHKWHAAEVNPGVFRPKRNVYQNGRYVSHYLYRDIYELIYGPIPDGKIVDHINGDTLDNRLCNLRIITPRQNCQNKAMNRAGRLPGTSFRRGSGKWGAHIRVDGRLYHLGYFATEQEAHAAYLHALELIGESLVSLSGQAA